MPFIRNALAAPFFGLGFCFLFVALVIKGDGSPSRLWDRIIDPPKR